MTMDIVVKLRRLAARLSSIWDSDKAVPKQAADEIDQLRVALQAIADWDSNLCHYAGFQGQRRCIVDIKQYARCQIDAMEVVEATPDPFDEFRKECSGIIGNLASADAVEKLVKRLMK